MSGHDSESQINGEPVIPTEIGFGIRKYLERFDGVVLCEKERIRIYETLIRFIRYISEEREIKIKLGAGVGKIIVYTIPKFSFIVSNEPI